MQQATPNPVHLADEIARQLGQFAYHLSRLPADEATRVIARVLDPEDGVLGRFTYLVATGSHFARGQAERGALPPEVWLALGRAANQLHDIGLDFDEHADTLTALSTRAGTTPPPPASAAPLVVRRRR